MDTNVITPHEAPTNARKRQSGVRDFDSSYQTRDSTSKHDDTQLVSLGVPHIPFKHPYVPSVGLQLIAIIQRQDPLALLAFQHSVGSDIDFELMNKKHKLLKLASLHSTSLMYDKLVNLGCNPATGLFDSDSPLCTAISAGNAPMVHHLLYHSSLIAIPYILDSIGNALFSRAVLSGSLQTVQLTAHALILQQHNSRPFINHMPSLHTLYGLEISQTSLLFNPLHANFQGQTALTLAQSMSANDPSSKEKYEIAQYVSNLVQTYISQHITSMQQSSQSLSSRQADGFAPNIPDLPSSTPPQQHASLQANILSVHPQQEWPQFSSSMLLPPSTISSIRSTLSLIHHNNNIVSTQSSSSQPSSSSSSSSSYHNTTHYQNQQRQQHQQQTLTCTPLTSIPSSSTNTTVTGDVIPSAANTHVSSSRRGFGQMSSTSSSLMFPAAPSHHCDPTMYTGHHGIPHIRPLRIDVGDATSTQNNSNNNNNNNNNNSSNNNNDPMNDPYHLSLDGSYGDQHRQTGMLGDIQDLALATHRDDEWSDDSPLLGRDSQTIGQPAPKLTLGWSGHSPISSIPVPAPSPIAASSSFWSNQSDTPSLPLLVRNSSDLYAISYHLLHSVSLTALLYHTYHAPIIIRQLYRCNITPSGWIHPGSSSSRTRPRQLSSFSLGGATQGSTLFSGSATLLYSALHLVCSSTPVFPYEHAYHRHIDIQALSQQWGVSSSVPLDQPALRINQSLSQQAQYGAEWSQWCYNQHDNILRNISLSNNNSNSNSCRTSRLSSIWTLAPYHHPSAQSPRHGIGSPSSPSLSILSSSTSSLSSSSSSSLSSSSPPSSPTLELTATSRYSISDTLLSNTDVSISQKLSYLVYAGCIPPPQPELVFNTGESIIYHIIQHCSVTTISHYFTQMQNVYTSLGLIESTQPAINIHMYTVYPPLYAALHRDSIEYPELCWSYNHSILDCFTPNGIPSLSPDENRYLCSLYNDFVHKTTQVVPGSHQSVHALYIQGEWLAKKIAYVREYRK